MEDKHKEIITANRNELVLKLYMDDCLLLDFLEQEKTLSAAMREQIEAVPTKMQKASKLLSILITCGKHAFKNFLSALVETRQEYLAVILDPEGEYYTPQQRLSVAVQETTDAVQKTTEDVQEEKQEVSVRSSKRKEKGICMVRTYGLIEIEMKCITDENDSLMRRYFHFPPNSVYKMNSRPRGRALIIKNREFPKRSPLMMAVGHDYDAANMVSLLEKLQYWVRVETDLTAKQMHCVLQGESEMEEHAVLDSFVCVILSHGNTDIVYGVDDEKISIEDITSYFDSGNCLHLRQKPKVFIVSANTGINNDRGVHVITQMDAVTEDGIEAAVNKLENLKVNPQHLEDIAEKMRCNEIDSVIMKDIAPAAIQAGIKELVVDENIKDVFKTTVKHVSPGIIETALERMNGSSYDCFGEKEQKIPSKGDIIVAYSAYKGYRAWRNANFGSWFIRLIVEVFMENAHNMHIEELFKKVRRRMSLCQTLNHNHYKQVTSEYTSLLKDMYFFPGLTNEDHDDQKGACHW